MWSRARCPPCRRPIDWCKAQPLPRAVSPTPRYAPCTGLPWLLVTLIWILLQPERHLYRSDGRSGGDTLPNRQSNNETSGVFGLFERQAGSTGSYQSGPRRGDPVSRDQIVRIWSGDLRDCARPPSLSLTGLLDVTGRFRKHHCPGRGDGHATPQRFLREPSAPSSPASGPQPARGCGPATDGRPAGTSDRGGSLGRTLSPSCSHRGAQRRSPSLPADHTSWLRLPAISLK